jgi:hypothetical protein
MTIKICIKELINETVHAGKGNHGLIQRKGKRYFYTPKHPG